MNFLYFANSGVMYKTGPNGKFSGNFVWLDKGLPNTEKESSTLDESVFTNSDLCCLAIYIHLCSTLLNFQVKIKKLFEM